ncbi:MAG: MFS transporter [Candidatus Thorarchaeota archaeon]
MDEVSTKESQEMSSSSISRKIPLLGLLTLLTIAAAALLHVNQPEFILGRFVNVSEFEYALFDGVLYLSYLIFGLTTGALSDRWKRRRLFIIIGSASSVPFYWLMTLAESYSLLLVFRFLQGVFTVMVWQTLMTLALDFSTPHNRGKNMGVFGAFLSISYGNGSCSWWAGSILRNLYALLLSSHPKCHCLCYCSYLFERSQNAQRATYTTG